MHDLERQLFYLFWFIPASPGVVLPWVITAILAGGTYFATRHLTLIPGRTQVALEYALESLADLLKIIVGEKHVAEMLPFFSTVFVYITTANLLGLVPGLKSPTSLFSNCLGMSLIIFLMTHYTGFRHHGFSYVMHFCGDPWWMAPIFLPIHLVGELSRPISLSLRLFGNIMGEDVVVLVLTVALFPLLIPIPMFFLMIFTSVVQALVFTILASIYVSGAIGSEEH
jgi:F-type H+-transporting ATPase subunit a